MLTPGPGCFHCSLCYRPSWHQTSYDIRFYMLTSAANIRLQLLTPDSTLWHQTSSFFSFQVSFKNQWFSRNVPDLRHSTGTAEVPALWTAHLPGSQLLLLRWPLLDNSALSCQPGQESPERLSSREPWLRPLFKKKMNRHLELGIGNWWPDFTKSGPVAVFREYLFGKT